MPRPCVSRSGSGCRRPSSRWRRQACLLVGARRSRLAVVDSGHRRRLDLLLELPDGELEAAIPAAQFDEIVDRIAGHVTKHRTTLVFVNTRKLSEWVAHQLGERLGPGGRPSRVAVTGSAGSAWSGGYERAICARWWPPPRWSSASTSGRSSWCARSALRTASQPFCSGLWPGQPPARGRARGVVYPTTRDELVECVALLAAVGRGRLDALHPPEQPLDVLAQQIVAEAAAGGDDGVGEDELFDLVTRAWPYRRLPGGVRGGRRAGLGRHRDRRGRRMAYLHRDRVAGLRGRRGARLATLTSGGAIPRPATTGC